MLYWSVIGFYAANISQKYKTTKKNHNYFFILGVKSTIYTNHTRTPYYIYRQYCQ